MSLVPTESGEVTPFDPTDFLQFAGIGGVFKPVSSLIKPLEKQGIKELAPITESLGKKIANFFSKPVTKAATGAGAVAGTVAATTIPKQVTQTITKNGISTIDKALIGGGIASVTAITGLLTNTPGGQNLVNTAGDIGKGATNIGQTIANNPIILIALIGLGALVILKK